MNLIKEQWNESDRKFFLEYLESFRNREKEAWSKRILNTNMDVLCIPTKKLYEISQEISRGNYTSFLDLKMFNSYDSIVVYGKVMSKIKDFNLMKTYLEHYLLVMENWAHCDLLSFQVNQKNKNSFLELSKKYLISDHTFTRRLSLLILFQMVNDETILDNIYDSLKYLENEQAYYVIMMAGWLLCECLIKHKEKTKAFLFNTPTLNKKIVNKGIQKCRESRRFSKEEKEELLIYKR